MLVRRSIRKLSSFVLLSCQLSATCVDDTAVAVRFDGAVGDVSVVTLASFE